MSQFSFMLEIEPVSVNHSHCFGKGFRYKLPKTRKYEIELKKQLSVFKDEFSAFHSSFNPLTNYISASYSFYAPKDFFYTKEKKISKRSKDLDNCIKIVQDNIFKFIGIDDTFVTDIEAVKRPTNGKEWRIVVMLSIGNTFNSLNNDFDFSNHGSILGIES